jgi:flagellar motility protein MotE (MotC chaperone)
MTLKIPAPRLLPMTITMLAVLLLVKCGELAEAALNADHRAERGLVATAKAAGAQTGGEHGKLAAKPAPPVEQKNSPGTAVSDGPPPISDSEKAVLLELRQRRKELDALAESIAARESLLVAAEQKVAARVTELQFLQKKLEGVDAAQKQKEDAGWQSLVKMYEAMKPKDAATIFNELSMPVLLQVLDRMKEAKAAAIMSAMTPERARDVTAEMAQARTGRNSSASAAGPGSSAAGERSSGG